MSESQAFFLLSVLCDRLLPGYYSTTMYGTLLDQRVFESLVEKTMPILWDHLVKSDVQLSVISLPWFLSLYINSMPLDFAFRVLDVFFLEGPKVLFQIGLAILRINGEELLDVTDDGTFISVLKTYFSRLHESAHPRSENEKLRAVTRFQELMVVAFMEFSGITQSTISEQRAKHKDAVLDSIESFAKRTSIRNLGPDSKRLSLDDLAFLYDRFYGILYERQQRMDMLREESKKRAQAGNHKAMELATGIAGSTVEMGRVGLGPSPTLMNYDGFREFLAGITKWAITDSPTSSRQDSIIEKDHQSNTTRSRQNSMSPWGAGNSEPADHDFMQRLYGRWNKGDNDGLSLQDVVSGLAQIKGTSDIMASISYFFELYDDDQDGKVDREGILRISEALLFLTRRGLEGTLSPSPSMNGLNDSIHEDSFGNDNAPGASTNERFLSSVSAFIRRCFEYADPDHPQNQGRASKPQPTDTDPLTTGIETFSIDSSSSSEDLLDLADATTPITPTKPNPTTPTKPTTTTTTIPSPTTNTPNTTTQTPPTPTNPTTANLALDPANPLHITLPTFRMLILADDLLQQFFESAFSASFRLSPSTSPSPTPSSNLTTFSNIGAGARRSTATSTSTSASATSTGAGGIGGVGGGVLVVPPSKGLRSVLDSIVSDGMRVAAEVRKRMDELERQVQEREREREGERGRGADEGEGEGEGGDENGYEGRGSYSYGGEAEAERRSVREGDRELLEGAEAEVGVGGGGRADSLGGSTLVDVGGLGGEVKEVEFER